MTPDELRDLCNSGKPPLEFAAALRDLDEATRKKLSTTAQEMVKESKASMRETEAQFTYQSGVKEDPELVAEHVALQKALRLSQLSLFAVGPLSAVKNYHRSLGSNDARNEKLPEAIVIMLTGRRPDWSDEWVNHVLDNQEGWNPLLQLWHVRDLMQANVIERPTSDGYINMLGFLPGTTYESKCNADILEHDIWRLFEVDTWAFHTVPSLKEIDRECWASSIEPTESEDRWFSHPYSNEGWPRTLFFLSEQGIIDRARLIDCTLAAFWRGFGIPIVCGLLRFHDLLAPTDDEIVVHEAAYRELLRNETGTVVALAIKALGRLQKVKRLDVPAFLNEVPGVFNISQKAQPKSAMSLIDRITKKDAEHRMAALPAMTAALNHEHADIQEQAVTLLSKWHTADPTIDLTGVLEAATMIAPQHRKTLEDMSGTSPTPAAGQESLQDTPPSDLAAREQAIHERLAALPEWIRTVTCLNGIPDALSNGELPPPFDPPPECPVLSGVEPIEPIKDVDALIEAAGRLQEHIESADEIERVVDGILRLGGETSGNFEEKTAAIRACKPETQSDGPSSFSDLNTMYPSVLAMIGEFASPGHGDEHASSPSFISSASPFQARYVELYGRVKTRDFGEMLSFPTHSKGWIDPRVFVDRLQRRTQSDRPLGRLDFICALLRLAPDFRAESLQKVEQLKEPYRRIVRFALGAAEYPTEADNDHVTEWLAAGRSRDPMGRLSELEALQSEMIRDDEPNNIRPAEFTWQPDQAARTIGRKRDAFAGYLIPWLNARGVVSFEPDAINRTDMVERPTVALIMTLLVSTVRLTYVDWVQLLAASHWPGNPETTMAVACRMLTVHLNDDVVTHAPLNAVMDPLLRVDQRWSDLVYVAICLGLVSKNSQTTGGAVDALIDGITDGRADALRLGATLVHVASGGWMKLNRLTDALREVVRTSVLAERVVGEILDRLIASWESLPRDGHHVLSLQVELLASLEHELSPQAREVLSGVKGSGKAVKLAKQLCAMQSSPASVPMKQAAIEAAEGRLARAERIDRYLRQAQRASSD